MKTYKAMSLGDLIAALRELDPHDTVVEIDPFIHSYRGYYERNAVSQNYEFPFEAHELADRLEEQVGKTMAGYGGGEYDISAQEAVYLAGEGNTGPHIIGLEKDPETGYYAPVLLEENWRF